MGVVGVVGVVVGCAVFPHAEKDADPLEGEGADGSLVFHAGGFLQVVEGFRPGAPASGVVGELVEGLFEELSQKFGGKRGGTGPMGTDRFVW